MTKEDTTPSVSSGKNSENSLSIAFFHASACVKDSAVRAEFKIILVNRNFMLLTSIPGIVFISLLKRNFLMMMRSFSCNDGVHFFAKCYFYLYDDQ